jgi:CelD/BcsL family acetyltransferase involved in cellulose biosynthesis
MASGCSFEAGDLDTALSTITGLSEEHRAGWRELASQRSESAPFVDEEWITSCIEAFRPREPILVWRWEDGRLLGLAALQRLTESWAGRKIAVLQSLTNPESYRFDFLSLQGRADLQEELWRTLCQTERWDVIRVDHLPEGSPTLTAGLKVAQELGWQRLVEPTFESPWRPLAQPPLSWDQGLTRRFKANLRNRERRLQQLGEVTFEVTRGTAEQNHALEIFYTLEASGWKGERGTAIARRAHVKVFYDRLVERASPQIWIPILAVSERPAAAQLIRVQGRTMFMLKTAYHPDFSPLAPGQLLTARVIRYGIENGMDALDFLADNMPWKADWAPRFRRHYRLLLFAPSARGHYAYWTRYGIREQASRIPGAGRLVRWVRARWGRK